MRESVMLLLRLSVSPFLFQINRNLIELKEKEYLVREFLRENNFENVRSLFGSLFRTDCKIVVTNSLEWETLLYLGIKLRNRKLVSFLVECGVDVNERLLAKDKTWWRR